LVKLAHCVRLIAWRKTTTVTYSVHKIRILKNFIAQNKQPLTYSIHKIRMLKNNSLKTLSENLYPNKL